ncbi:SLBB domain-containing protein [Colwellia sp. 20A7]|uniref:SLBB domain-containing protein n=1 Tax=Colwellia sp. 20A7 TaxID=2689569 RepID=UPI00135A439C|nr:SLBB domain-containing protein [Colwellia sp. 20A7]
MDIFKKIKLAALVSSSLITASIAVPSEVQAASPSAAQIAQFQSLPKSQQEALASQYGIDMATLQSQDSKQQEIEIAPTIGKRQVNAKTKNELTLFGDENELTLFGYELFAGEPTSMAPLGDIPAPADYMMGTGDELHIQIFGKENSNYSFKVKRDGSIDIPRLGPFMVAGETFDQVKHGLATFIKNKIIGVEVTVSLGTLRTMQVFVLGDAYKPGTYVLSSLATVTQALRAAGGIDTLGSLRNIQIKRSGELLREIDLYDLLLNGNTHDDMRLRDGDTLFIPPRGATIEVDGEVRRRAIYELTGPTSIMQVIHAAGGFTERAFSQQINVARTTASGTDIFNIDVNNAQERNFKIIAGDSIKVMPVPKDFNNAIGVLGAVERPGAYSWKQGLRLIDILGNSTQDLTPETDYNYGLIVREINQQGDIEVLQFSLAKAIAAPNSSDNLLLQKRDQVVVLNKDIGRSLEESTQTIGATENRLETMRRETLNSRENLSTQNEDTQEKESNERLAKIANTELGDISEDNMTDTEQMGQLKIDNLSNNTNLQRSAQEIRTTLLEPIIAQLKAQASITSPVQIVEIRGAVKFPGVYPLAKKQNLTDLIAAAGGMKESAHLARAEMSRIIEQNGHTNIVHRDINLAKMLSAESSNAQPNQAQSTEAKLTSNSQQVALISKDRINVFSKPEWREDLSIELGGEVLFPGRYTFKRGETLLDLINRAGGLTEYAYPKGSIFSRESLRDQEAQKLRYLHEQLRQEVSTLAFRRQSSATSLSQSSPVGEAMDVVDKLGVTKAVGRMVINLDQVVEGDKNQNLVLENGDKLYIPPLRNIVTVMGHIQMPTSLIYDDNMTVQDYINATGGAKKQADTDRIYVIRANGSVMLPDNSYWFNRKEEKLLPGDTIVVPMDTDYVDGLTILGSATQMMYQIGVAWAAIK